MDLQTNTNSPLGKAVAGSKGYYWFLVIFLVVLSAQGSFVNDMYTPALPQMCRVFGCSVSLSQMGLTLGMAGLGIGQIVLGPVSDKYGRKPVLIITTVIFILAAIGGTFARSIHVFNICRLFQGMGASSGYFLAKTIPADVYSGRALAKLMALVGAINGIAPASAPVIGGLMADHLGWKSIFYLLAGFAMVIIIITCPMKESLPSDRRITGPLWKSFGGYFRLLGNKPFMIHVTLKAFALGILFAYISSSPFIVQTHYGLNQTQYGLLIGFNAIFLAVGSIISLRFKPYKKAAFIGTMIAVAGVAGETIALFTIHSLWVYDAFMVVILFSAGMIFATSNTLAMNEGRDQSGEASAIIGVAGYVIGAIVAPLVGLGNVIHSTAIAYMALTVPLIIFAILTRRQPADLNA